MGLGRRSRRRSWGGAGASVRKRAEWAVGLGTPSAVAARGLCSGSWSGCPGKVGRGGVGRWGQLALGIRRTSCPGEDREGCVQLLLTPGGWSRGCWGLVPAASACAGASAACSRSLPVTPHPVLTFPVPGWVRAVGPSSPHFADGEPGPRSRDLAGRARRGLGLCSCPARHVGLGREPSDLRELSCRSEVCGLLAWEGGSPEREVSTAGD